MLAVGSPVVIAATAPFSSACARSLFEYATRSTSILLSVTPIPSAASALLSIIAAAPLKPSTPIVLPFKSAMELIPESCFVRIFIQPLCIPDVNLIARPFSIGRRNFPIRPKPASTCSVATAS